MSVEQFPFATYVAIANRKIRPHQAPARNSSATIDPNINTLFHKGNKRIEAWNTERKSTGKKQSA